MLFALALTQVALATPPAGAEATVNDHGCQFYTGPRHSSGYDKITVQCVWADLSVEKINSMLSVNSLHDELFNTVAVAVSVGTHQGRELFRQVHQASGLSDREVVIEQWRTTITDGFRYNHRIHSDQSAVTGDNVAPEVNEGAWTVTSRSGGGSNVQYELVYAPGGWVPRFVVNRFQSDGIVSMVGGFRTYLQTH
jgi:hypothetical protein